MFPGEFEPKTGKPIDPATGEVSSHNKFDPDTGRPLDLATGKPIPVDPKTNIPTDPQGKTYPGKFDPETSKKIDPEQDLVAPDRYDANNGTPVEPSTNSPLPIDPESKQPYNPLTGAKYPGQYDPQTGQPIDPDTKQAIPDRFSSQTSQPINPKTGKEFPIDPATGHPIDPDTKQKKPGNFDKAGKPIDPVTKKPLKEPEQPKEGVNNKNNYVPRQFVQVVRPDALTDFRDPKKYIPIRRTPTGQADPMSPDQETILTRSSSLKTLARTQDGQKESTLMSSTEDQQEGTIHTT